MCQKEDTTKRRKYKQFTESQRYKLEGYLDVGLSISKIAKLLDKNQSSVRREIRKGTITLRDSQLREYEKYCADVAERETQFRNSNKGAKLKIGNDHELAKEIERLICEEKYSPDATIMKINKSEKQYKTRLCTKTIYNYIHKGIFLNINRKDLITKRDNKERILVRRVSSKHLTANSIEDRPKHIENREKYGHQEMDLVIGKKGSKEALLVFTERKTRQEIIRKIPSKTQDSVIRAIDRLERELGTEFKSRFKTVTSDNGSEFLDYESLEKSAIHSGKRFKLYYAHPYSSWERGSNENANKLIRRFIPKGADIGEYSDEEIRRIERWINNYPRRLFGGKSANEMVA